MLNISGGFCVYLYIGVGRLAYSIKLGVVFRKSTFLKISFVCALFVSSVLKTKRTNQGTLKEFQNMKSDKC